VDGRGTFFIADADNRLGREANTSGTMSAVASTL
jgi:hypothetical protein